MKCIVGTTAPVVTDPINPAGRFLDLKTDWIERQSKRGFWRVLNTFRLISKKNLIFFPVLQTILTIIVFRKRNFLNFNIEYMEIKIIFNLM